MGIVMRSGGEDRVSKERAVIRDAALRIMASHRSSSFRFGRRSRYLSSAEPSDPLISGTKRHG